MQKSTKELAEKKKKKVKSGDEKNVGATRASKAKVSERGLAVEKKRTGNKVGSEKKVASKKSTTNKANAKKATGKKTSEKKGLDKSKNKRKTTNKKSSRTRVSKKKPEIIEYYDLPYRYNQTVVKILAQTPKTLFVYWDISDDDRKRYAEKFGEKFFENTVPVLIVHNKTMNYSFEIEINDFANSWYFNVNDAKCDYEIELGRRARTQEVSLPNNYMYVASSNVIEAPNNHILFEQNQKTLFFRNVKTNTTTAKDVSQFPFMKYMGRIYNIYDIYRKIYRENELQELRKMPGSKFQAKEQLNG